MTILYRTIEITSAEQAEALPEGAFMIDAVDRVARRETSGPYSGRWLTEEDGCLNDPVMPSEALVPIEAEEEWSARQPHPGGGTRGRTRFGVHESKARQFCETVDSDVVERRLVTPWEPA